MPRSPRIRPRRPADAYQRKAKRFPRGLLGSALQPSRVPLPFGHQVEDLPLVPQVRGHDLGSVPPGAGANVAYALYDLATDPLGAVDVKERHPELLAELVARMQARSGGVAETCAGDDASSAAALQALGYAGD